MELKELQRNWNDFASSDPLWAILTWHHKRERRWDLPEFFETGQREIERVLQEVAALNFPLRRGRALDFGCGVGRLTQSLGDHFDECYGVDIAPSMIQLARQYNRHDDRCTYLLNEADNLAILADHHFDFIYCILVLQHMRPEYSTKYMREFVRILAPGGLAIFQMMSVDSSAEAMPAEAFRARIAVDQSRLGAKAGAVLSFPVTVVNTSNTAWAALALGNHWLDGQGNLLVKDDGRAPLSPGIRPQEQCTVDLTVHVPQRAGLYLLELDLVQEHVAWFKDKGSPSTVVPARIHSRHGLIGPFSRWFRRPLTKAATASADAAPVMEMHVLPKQDILALLTAAGARILDVRVNENQSAAGFQSYSYFLTK